MESTEDFFHPIILFFLHDSCYLSRAWYTYLEKHTEWNHLVDPPLIPLQYCENGLLNLRKEDVLSIGERSSLSPLQSLQKIICKSQPWQDSKKIVHNLASSKVYIFQHCSSQRWLWKERNAIQAIQYFLTAAWESRYFNPAWGSWRL